MHSHIRKVYACLTVTCHLHFWQNDRDLLRATAVTRGWNGYVLFGPVCSSAVAAAESLYTPARQEDVSKHGA